MSYRSGQEELNIAFEDAVKHAGSVLHDIKGSQIYFFGAFRDYLSTLIANSNARTYAFSLQEGPSQLGLQRLLLSAERQDTSPGLDRLVANVAIIISADGHVYMFDCLKTNPSSKIYPAQADAVQEYAHKLQGNVLQGIVFKLAMISPDILGKHLVERAFTTLAAGEGQPAIAPPQ
ncbi:MAG: hypothetical protein J0L77_02390 [Alphaproteobacteria bacterium]|nr:hypothetical protein [Alphaproteobacteria bacterium]